MNGVRNLSCHLCGSIAVILASVLSCGLVRADDGDLRLFDFEPRISVSEAYSDGGVISTGSSGGWITSVDPGFKLSRQAARLKTNINYSLGNRYYSEDGHTSVRHRLGGNALAELIQRELFIDASFSKRDQLISPLGTANIDSGLQRDNLTSSTSWSVGPRWQHQFGQFAISSLDYQLDRVSFDRKAASDSWSTSIGANLSSGALFNTWFWAADYSDNNIRYLESDDRSEFEMYSATLGYNLTRKLNVFYVLGDEKNSYRNSVGKTGGSYWNIGAGFTPSVRTSLKASFGKRFFGDTYSLALTHQARKWRVSLSRDETVTTIRQRQLGDIFLICPPEIPDCTPEEAIAFGVDVGIRDGTYIQKSLTGSVAYSLVKSTMTLSMFDRSRQFRDGSGRNDETSGMALGWNWNLGPRTNFNSSAGWTRYKVLTTPLREDDRWFLRVGIRRSLAPDLRGSLNYTYQRRTSNVDGAGFNGNTVSAQLTKTF
jgi:uncharacterized protein (PEP-CTERM system associated)